MWSIAQLIAEWMALVDKLPEERDREAGYRLLEETYDCWVRAGDEVAKSFREHYVGR